MADQTENGSSFPILTLIDEHTRQCLAIHRARSIRAIDVIMVCGSSHSPLRSARSPAQRQWARIYRLLHAGLLKAQAIKTLYIKPGSPWENGHIESFHDKLRDECLNRELFGNLHEARVILESWRVEYNERRPHSSLGYQSPNEYACRRMNRFDGGCAPPNPAPLTAAGVREELRSKATKW